MNHRGTKRNNCLITIAAQHILQLTTINEL